MLDHLDRIGVRAGPALDQARALLHDPDRLVPIGYAGALFAEAQRVAGSAALGLRVGETTRLMEMGEWGAVIRGAVTVAGLLRAATTTATRFNSGQRFWLARKGSDVWLCARFSPRVTQGRAAMVQFQLMMTLEGIRLAAGPHWRPTEIHLEGPPPPHAEEIAALAVKRVVFEQPCTVLVFPATVMALRFPDSPPRLPVVLAGPAPAAEFEHACRQVVESLLKLGVADLSAAAELTQMSERSLQRGLAARGFTFKHLVESVRFESAVRMLDDPSAKIVEIAADLGYTDSANFTRAFRRWSGVPPRAFRRDAELRHSMP